MKIINSKQPYIHSAIDRRQFLTTGLGAAGAAILSPRRASALVSFTERNATPACTLSREQTEGPYYVDRRILRSNITEGKPGTPLRLRITVLDATRCVPVQKAAVDLWHCDASGIYSGYTKNNPDSGFGGGPGGPRPGPPPGGGPPRRPTTFLGGRDPGPPSQPGFPPPGRSGPSDNKTFFRGIQITDEAGTVEFATIYPGWYVGRSVHIHMKVWTNGATVSGKYEGGHACHTGQLFFPEDVTDTIARQQPYREHHARRTLLQEDDIYNGQAGPDCLVRLEPADKRSLEQGFLATAVLAINPLLTPNAQW